MYTVVPPYIQLEAFEVGLPPFHHLAIDLLTWKGSSFGHYSARSGYDWLLAKHECCTVMSKSWVWKVKAAEKIRALLWLAVHEALPTNLLRFQRHLVDSTSCPICGAVEETISHLFFSCPWTASAWSRLGGLQAGVEQIILDDIGDGLRII